MIPITFEQIRKFCARNNRVSICMQETLQYENYESILEVPERYNPYYLYGFGIIGGEFRDERMHSWDILACMEIRLSQEPRTDIT